MYVADASPAFFEEILDKQMRLGYFNQRNDCYEEQWKTHDYYHYQKLSCEKPCEKPCENQLNFTHFSYDFHNISHMFHMLISHAYEIAACEEYVNCM